ncbi:hypothetical protein EXIGLDRAFT_746637 [Exidia glandulosa HHB12029]|uniref:RNase H type-1 domain-containing protein n=1 Tax=Exidia glandulosa HHB12029 TaxID=1314781 RepID=A0A165LWD4_EXIGL|nr:hypothetical protein EXIGLDRAFT_746637 [Exidia glandulosa HHB12029]
MIKTRSEYAVQSIRDWLPGFIRNAWRTREGKPVQNRELLQYVGALMDMRGVAGQRVQLGLVKDSTATSDEIDGLNSASYLAALASTDPAPRKEPAWDTLRADVEKRAEGMLMKGQGVALRMKNSSSSAGPSGASPAAKKNEVVVYPSSSGGKENVGGESPAPKKRSMLESAQRMLERREIVPVIEIEDDDDDFELTEDQLAALDEIEASQSSQVAA